MLYLGIGMDYNFGKELLATLFVISVQDDVVIAPRSPKCFDADFQMYPIQHMEDALYLEDCCNFVDAVHSHELFDNEAISKPTRKALSDECDAICKKLGERYGLLGPDSDVTEITCSSNTYDKEYKISEYFKEYLSF